MSNTLKAKLEFIKEHTDRIKGKVEKSKSESTTKK